MLSRRLEHPKGDDSRLDHSSNGVSDFAEVLSAARRSDHALADLLEEFRNSLRRLAEDGLDSDVRPKVGASDLVQQTLLEATKGFSAFRGESREQLQAWMRRILVRNLLNEVRKWRSTKMRSIDREVTLDVPGAVPLASPDETPSCLVAAREQEMLLREALGRLTPDQQEVIRLRHFEQLGFEEIARRLNRRYSAARMLWYRAFEKLIQAMGEGHEPTG